MREFFIGVAIAIVAIAVFSWLGGCTTNKAQSWDQENLKRNDHGCPTAIFVAPKGELVQCP